MTSHDAVWVAQNVTAATWAIALGLDPLIEDVECAVEAEAWATAMEAGAIALIRVGHCLLLLEGYAGHYDEMSILAALALRLPALADELCELAPAFSAGRAEAQALLDALRGYELDIRRRLPFELPNVRTPQGFFPGLGTARQLERLREAVGLMGYEPQWEV